MSDMDTIKARIRKLMAVAGDGVATDGEIDNAMRLAAKLLDAHHLNESDIPGEQDEQDMTMGRSAATTQSVRFSTWESVLSNAVVSLFGCVRCYISHEKAPQRVNGIAVMDGSEVRKGRKLYFYGPATESQEAAELFEEWARSIATMGVARWGGCFRGDGAMYCYGFASALRKKAFEIDAERRMIEAKPLPGNTSTAIMLADRYGQLAKLGKDWLKEECHVHLSSSGSRTGYSAGDSGAYAEGRSHGQAASFGRQKARRALPGE